MYMICRRQGTPSSEVFRLECVGNCIEFVSHFLKYNISDSDVSRMIVFKAEEVPMEEFIEISSTLEDDLAGKSVSSDKSAVMQPEEKRKVVKKKEKDCGCGNKGV